MGERLSGGGLKYRGSPHHDIPPTNSSHFIRLTPFISCPKVGTFGYQDHQGKRYSTSDSGSHLRRLVDCRSQRPSSHRTTSPLVQSQKFLTQVQRPLPRTSPEDSVWPQAPLVSKASCGTRHSTTPGRSVHLLVKSPRMVEAFLTNLLLLKKPPGWHSRQLGSPWPVLDLECQTHPHW